MARIVFQCFIVLMLSGCGAVVPRYDISNDPDGAPSVAAITRKIRCELTDVVSDPKKYPLLIDQDVIVGVQLNLTVNDSGSLAPSFSYMSGPFAFFGGAAFNQSREQNYSETVHYSLKQLRDDFLYEQHTNHIDTRICPISPYNLEGDLGLRQTVDLAMRSPDLDWSSKSTGAIGGVFGGYVSFGVTKNVNAVGPIWTLQHFVGPGKLAGISEVNNDKLVFAFAATQNTPPAKEAAAEKVDIYIQNIVVNQLATQLAGVRQGLQ